MCTFMWETRNLSALLLETEAAIDLLLFSFLFPHRSLLSLERNWFSVTSQNKHMIYSSETIIYKIDKKHCSSVRHCLNPTFLEIGFLHVIKIKLNSKICLFQISRWLEKKNKKSCITSGSDTLFSNLTPIIKILKRKYVFFWIILFFCHRR